jgi:predicted O-methyltransferase YrrM
MLRDKPLHNFLFECDEHGFFDGLETYCTPWIDVCVILSLLRKHRSRSFLEVGTHEGYTTRNIKRKLPHLDITTVDPGDKIPPEQRPPNQFGEYLPQEKIGRLLRDYPDVKILKEPFEKIDFGNKRFDFIFIDGHHGYHEVQSDTRRALALVNRPGVIAWHDVNNVRSVNDAICSFEGLDAVTLHNTWIAYSEIR